jgi:hypothetical protein
MRCSLRNPLGVARLINELELGLNAAGLTVKCGSDMAEFAQLKKTARGFDPAPMHDYTVCDFSGDRAFWMSLTNSSGTVVGLQAYRCDQVDINLSEWCSNYMIGVYMRRNELMVPSHNRPPKGSIADRLNGKLVYHGELWVERELKNRKVIEHFSKLGSLLILLRWNPDAIWALTGFHMATRGYASRMGYPYIERGFLRWAWHSDNVDQVEYLAVAERDYLQQIVEETLDGQSSDEDDNITIRQNVSVAAK